jgi:hypothetical protein
MPPWNPCAVADFLWHPSPSFFVSLAKNIPIFTSGLWFAFLFMYQKQTVHIITL